MGAIHNKVLIKIESIWHIIQDDYDIIEKSQFILKHCKQKELNEYKFNPLVFTIFKIVKVLKDRSSVNYKKISSIPVGFKEEYTNENNLYFIS